MSAPDGPLFPGNAGGVIHAILNPEPSAGPPYAHVFREPPDEYDDEGNVLPKPVGPSFTVGAVAALPANGPRGRWSYGPWGTGVPLFIEDPDFGVYVAPTAFLPFTLPPVPNPCRGTVFDRGALARAACGTRRPRLDAAIGPDVRTGHG